MDVRRPFFYFFFVVFAARLASISCFIARRFLVFFERDVFLFSIPVLRFAMFLISLNM